MKAAIRTIGIYKDGTLYANVQTSSKGPTQYASGVPHAVFALVDAFVRNQTAQRRMGSWSWEWKNGYLGRTLVKA